MKLSLISAAVVATVLLASSSALADSSEPPPDEPRPTPFVPTLRQAAGLEAYWFSAKGTGSAFTLIPYALFDLSKHVVFGVHFPVSIATDAPSEGLFGSKQLGVGLGNPTVGLDYVDTSGDTSLFFGGRIGLPLAGASNEVPWQAANLLGAVSMALYDAHYWAYKYLPIGLRLGIEHQAVKNVFLRGLLEPTLYVPLDDKSQLVSSRQAQLYYQMRFELEGRGESGFGGGMGVQLVHALSESNAFGKDDNAQAAVEPFVSYDSAGGGFARLGALVALDSPLGFGLDERKVAALRLNVGSHF